LNSDALEAGVDRSKQVAAVIGGFSAGT